MALCLELDIMIDRVISWTLLCFLLFLLDAGHCFRYDRDIERTLCRTQCAALCFDDKQSCARTCNNSMVYRFWMTNCDEPYSICIGTCQVLTPSSRMISNIFHTDYIYDDSVRYPPIPKLHIAAVEGDTILLTWDLPNDAYKVYHVIEMRYEDKEWNVLKEQIEDNQLNVTVPDICLYEFRIMAINQYGSNGFSAPLGVKSIPLEPIRNVSFVGNGLYYHEPTGEFMAIISWDEISSLDEHVVSHYSWNEMSYVNCPRPSQNMQPTFYKFNSKHGRKFILMRVSRDAYGCVFTTQIKAKSVCGEVGGWTNFTIDLSDCNKINNFPCSSVDPNFSDPGNVENVTIHVDKGQDPPLIRLSWFPPRDLGTAGKIDHYDIRWGKVYQKEPAFFLNQPDFVSVPNITHLSSVVREFAVSVTFQDLISSKYGFQIIPIAPSRHLGDAEYGLFEIYMIQSSRVGLVGNHSIHGTILLDGDEVKIVQVPNSLDVEVAWHLQQQGRRSINSSNEKLFFKNYAVKVGKLVKPDTGQHMVKGSVTLVDSSDAFIKLEFTDPGDYCLQIVGLEDDTLPVDDEWLATKIYNFTILDLKSSLIEYKDGFSVALQVILPVFIVISIPVIIIIIKWLHKIYRLKEKLRMERRLGDPTTDFSNDYANFDRHPLTSHYHNRDSENSFLPSTVVPDQWEIPHSCLKVGRVLGSGAFGQVLKGRVSKSVIVHRKLPIPKDAIIKGTYLSTAVKMLKDNADSCHKRDFIKEISLMKSIGFHINIVSMLGCCTLQDPICLIVEHLPHGDLKTYLSKIREVILMREGKEGHYVNKDVDILSPVDLLSFARQIAVGMEFLSLKGFIHRDLAARNILVGSNKIVKIGDFGLTRFVYNDQVYVNRNGGKFPLKWMSIEAIQELKFSTASDVWSFGIVLFEIVTFGGTPYPTIGHRELLEFLKNGHRMERPENCSLELYRVMSSCWEKYPRDRPTFGALKETLESMLLESCGLQYFSFMVDNTKHYYNIEVECLEGSVHSVSENQTNDDSCMHSTIDNSLLSQDDQHTNSHQKNVEVLRAEQQNSENDMNIADIIHDNTTMESCLCSVSDIENKRNNIQGNVGTEITTDCTSKLTTGCSSEIQTAIVNKITDLNKITDQIETGMQTTYESETDSSTETNKTVVHFNFETVSPFVGDDGDYEADDSSLSETSPSSATQRYSLSSSNEEDEVFQFPTNQVNSKLYLQEKHPRFKNRLIRGIPHQNACRQLSDFTDSGISTTSYSESPV